MKREWNMLRSKFAMNTKSLELIMLLIVFINLKVLVPRFYRDSSSRELVGGLLTWAGLQLGNIIKTSEFLSRIIPNAPLILVPLLAVVEVVSFLVRPCAIILRIGINLICRHLLLTMGGMVIIWRNCVVIGLVIVLECRVALIQRYVMTMIISL
jgi:F-type H+-transporting ATPase subunit a